MNKLYSFVNKLFESKGLPFLILFLAFVVRIAWIYLSKDVKIVGDGISYHGFALAITNKVNWLFDADFTGNTRPPIYPFFVAIIYKIFGVGNLQAIVIAHAFINTITIWYIYKFALLLFNRKVAILSILWAVFYIFYLKYTALINRETLIFLFMIMFLYYFYKITINKNSSTKLYLLCALLFVALLHTDPRYIVLTPFLLLMTWYYHGWKPGFGNAFKLGAFIILMIVPWTTRNYFAYNGLVIINTKDLDMRKEKDVSDFIYSSSSGGEVTHTIHDYVATEEERQLIKSGQNPNNRSKEEVQLILDDVYPASKFWERRWFMFKQFWRVTNFKGLYFPYPSANFTIWSKAHNLTNLVSYGIILPFFLIGLIILLFKDYKKFLFLFMPPFIISIFHAFIWSRERYRIPIDFIVITVAMMTIVIIGERIFRIKKPS